MTYNFQLPVRAAGPFLVNVKAGSSIEEAEVQIKEEEHPEVEKRPGAMKRSMSDSETEQKPTKKLAAPTAPAAAPLIKKPL
jgi:hypothetical protein